MLKATKKGPSESNLNSAKRNNWPGVRIINQKLEHNNAEATAYFNCENVYEHLALYEREGMQDLCVTLTRAQHGFIIVGNSKMFEHTSDSRVYLVV